jgi:hypothetical protein
MNGNTKFGIYIPSYKRADTISTHKLLEYYRVVVRESEKEAYLKVIPPENLITVPDGEIDNIIKVANWIVDNSEEEVIAMIDDDMNDLIYRTDYNEKITDPEVCTSELERIAQLMVDLGIGYGAVDASIAPWNYLQEFMFTGTSGGLRWFNKKVYKSRFDEKIGYCCDTDVVLQELLKNRIILKPKYLCSHGGTDTNKGGNSEKTRNSQIASFEVMKHRWGKYFDYVLKNNKIYIRVQR